LEAARWAPSCFNAQPWRFVVAPKRDAEGFEKLLGCLVEANRVWARDAAVLMLSVAALDFAHDGSPNRHALHDVGLAAAQLTLQAQDQGIRVHQMAGFDPARAIEVFNIPERHQPVAALALGYPGDPETLPEELKTREMAPRERTPQFEFAFSGAWGRAF